MKKGILFLLMLMFVLNHLQAQPTEELTNTTIVKMVRAKLSDDLIIGEINASKVNFDVSTDSINFLVKEKVSPAIIQAMKTANEKQTSPVPAVSELQSTAQAAELPVNEPKEPEPVVVINPAEQPAALPLQSTTEKPAVKDGTAVTVDNNGRELSISVEAMSYAIPLTDLMVFFDNEFISLSGTIQKWDEQVRNSMENDRQLRNQLKEIDLQLDNKKNADCNTFSSEIATLKNQRSAQRAKVQQFKKQMLTEGMDLAKKMKEMGNAMDNSISSRFSAVGNTVRSANADPSKVITKPLTITKKEIKGDVIPYIAPATGLLHFCQNEILSLKEIIVQKNQDIVEINQKDIELSRQLEPLQKKMSTLQENAKKNKKEIAALKKQISELEKERKALGQQMEKNSKELSRQLESMCKVVQATLEERYADIIDNVNYSYLDSFTGF